MSMKSLAEMLRANKGWLGDAKCDGKDPSFFFPEPPEDEDEIEAYEEKVEAAKEFCSDCPVRLNCREYAIGANEAHGVWGQTTGPERRRLKRDRRSREKIREEVAAHVAEERARGHVIQTRTRVLVRQEVRW